MRIALLLLLAICALVVASGSYALETAKYVTAEEVTGVVVDAETGKPLPGAVVAIRFKRSNTGHAGEHCFRSMAVETDAEGRFRFAPWKQENTRANATLGEATVYKQGYAQPARPTYVKQGSRSFAGIAFSDTIRIPTTEVHLAVEPFRGSDEERIKQLGRILGIFICRWQAESDDRVLLTKIREELAASANANQKPEPGRITILQRIDRLVQGDGVKR